MAEATDPLRRWTIQFTDDEVKPLASELAEALKDAGVEVPPQHKPPTVGSYGTPEVILTIVATAAAKALVVAALHAIERRLKQWKTASQDQRVQIVVDRPGELRKRFPFSLQEAGEDAIQEFVSSILDSVADL
jgi:hypothetical protein